MTSIVHPPTCKADVRTIIMLFLHTLKGRRCPSPRGAHALRSGASPHLVSRKGRPGQSGQRHRRDPKKLSAYTKQSLLDQRKQKNKDGGEDASPTFSSSRIILEEAESPEAESAELHGRNFKKNRKEYIKKLDFSRRRSRGGCETTREHGYPFPTFPADYSFSTGDCSRQ